MFYIGFVKNYAPIDLKMQYFSSKTTAFKLEGLYKKATFIPKM